MPQHYIFIYLLHPELFLRSTYLSGLPSNRPPILSVYIYISVYRCQSTRFVHANLISRVSAAYVATGKIRKFTNLYPISCSISSILRETKPVNRMMVIYRYQSKVKLSIHVDVRETSIRM